MAYLQADYARMENASASIKAISRAIDTELDTLRKRLQQMTWEGQDRVAYNQHQAQWDSALTDINTLLNEIGNAVGVARGNYMDTEKRNADVW